MINNLKEIIEAILFVAGDGVAFTDIAEKLNITLEEVEKAANELKTEKESLESGIQVLIYNGKAQLASNSKYVEQIAEVLNPIREKQLTKAVLEVCAIIAYKQPVTRLEIENIRDSRNCDYAISMLLDNNIVEVVGRKDAVGKPLLFGTTDTFLKKFGLKSIEELPDYEELLERIQILHGEKKDSRLFNFSDLEEETQEKEISEIFTSEEEKAFAEKLEKELDAGVLDLAIEDFGDFMSKEDVFDKLDELLEDNTSLKYLGENLVD